MNNILLLTDFSDSSINAIHYALNLFKDNTCDFFVLNVESSITYLGDDLMTVGNKSIYESLIKKPKGKLETLVLDLEKAYNNENFSFEALIDHDVFIDAINQVVKAKSIDLIVMGTNGVTGAKEVVFGSNTINVIRKVNCSTLVIPETFKYRAPKELVLPLGINDSISSKAFASLLTFAKQYSKKVHIIRVKPNDEVSLEEKHDSAYIEKNLNDINYEYHVVNHVPINYVVNSYIQTNPIDLIALLVHKESFFERFFIGSSTAQISNKLKLPLMVYHV
ncbi:universal stress protein [Winogradskyella sp.]|jgi:nucleotide-binding universal stress UspA family protein|uniref:universal stress protein n=1 Tax=Winogradskyella sp. TaxID=1883156 RepID=UPI0025CECD31|nr:universal stress protein [Winogradskyella sp.]MCT4628897.1 universal stress protein [Winogradskyella sp.]